MTAIIALCSPAMGSGKSEAALQLVERHGFHLVKFAGPLKDMTRALLHWHMVGDVELYVEGGLKEIPITGLADRLHSEGAGGIVVMLRALAPHLGLGAGEFDKHLLSEREKVFPAFPKLTLQRLISTLLYRWIGTLQEPVTPRRIMQTLGTEWGRDSIRQDFWTAIAYQRCRSLLDSGTSVVIDDMRFFNELETVTRLGGTPVRILRAAAMVVGGQHASEGELDCVAMREIHNNGTLDAFHHEISALAAETR